jgi:hypothetical protein
MAAFPAYNPKAASERESSGYRIIQYSGLNHTSAYERALYEAYQNERERQRALQLGKDRESVSPFVITGREFRWVTSPKNL